MVRGDLTSDLISTVELANFYLSYRILCKQKMVEQEPKPKLPACVQGCFHFAPLNYRLSQMDYHNESGRIKSSRA